MNWIKNYYCRQFYYLIFEGVLLLIPFFYLLTIGFYWITLIFAPYYIGIILYLIHALTQKKYRKKEGYEIGGFYKWNNVYEIHIGDVTPKQFYCKLARTIEYCQDKDLKLEYIAGNKTEKELRDQYGDAIIKLRLLSLYSKFLFKILTRNSKHTIIYPSKQLLKVLIDPQRINLHKTKTGRLIISKGN